MTQDAKPPRSAATRYREAGVDMDAGNELVRRIAPLARATARLGARPDLGGFGGVFDLGACGFRDPLLVASTDGVGTKLLLAIEAGRLDGIGQDLVAMCANDVVVQGAEPLFFLDYCATGRLAVDVLERLVAGMAEACRIAGCALIGGETAEMPGLYDAAQFDLAGFVVGAVERDALLPRPVEPGDLVLGLAASGAHANGYSLIRKVLREGGFPLHGPAPFAADRMLADVLLEPTRIYVHSCLRAIAAGGVRALAHITGGGLIENLPRVLPDGRVARLDARNWRLPPLFGWLARTAGVTPGELPRVFNCGIGMCLVVDPEKAERLEEILEESGEEVRRIGRIEAGDAAGVVIEGMEEGWQLSGLRY